MSSYLIIRNCIGTCPALTGTNCVSISFDIRADN